MVNTQQVWIVEFAEAGFRLYVAVIPGDCGPLAAIEKARKQLEMSED